MDVQVRLGPGLSQLVGAPRLTVTLVPGATVRDLRGHLQDAYPAVAVGLGSALALVRGTYVTDGHVLASGEEVALLSPVSGGSDGRDVEFSSRTEGSSWR